MVKIGRQKSRPNTLVSAASVRWRTLAEKVYYVWSTWTAPSSFIVVVVVVVFIYSRLRPRDCKSSMKVAFQPLSLSGYRAYVCMQVQCVKWSTHVRHGFSFYLCLGLFLPLLSAMYICLCVKLLRSVVSYMLCRTPLFLVCEVQLSFNLRL